MKHPCMTFWPEKFFADTAQLPGDAAAYYMVLLGHAWVRGASLPNDHDMLRRLARCDARRWGRIKHLILALWTLGEDGRLYQKRLTEEWERANRKHHKKPSSSYQSGITLFQDQQLDTPKKPNSFNGKHQTLARPRDPTPTPTENSLPLSGRESSLQEAQSQSEPPAPLRVLEAHAARAAPNGGGEIHAIFLCQGSPEWIAYETKTGRPLKAYSMHDGDPGAWVKP